MKYNRSVYRATEILELLSASKNALTLTEIMETLKIPKSSTFDILSTLVRLNVIEFADFNNKTYTIGPKAFKIGNSYVSKQDIFIVAKPYLVELAERLEKTAFLGTLYDDKVLYVLKHESEKSIITTSKIGSANYIHCTSLGKVLFAFSNKQDEYIDKISFESKTDNTITNKKVFLEEIEKVKKQGYSIDDRENEDHMLCIGAPIYDHNSNVSYAISIAGMYSNNADIEKKSKIVIETACKISEKLGYIK